MGPYGPKLAHLVPPLWSIVVLEKKVIRNVEISCFTKKEPKIGLKTFIRDFLRYFFSRVDFYGFSIFSYNFQPIWIILFAFSSQSDGLTIWRLECWIFVWDQNGTTWKYAYQKYQFLQIFFKIKWPPFCFEKKILNSNRQIVAPSDCEENAKGIIQIG